jgi:hypothetical protein
MPPWNIVDKGVNWKGNLDPHRNEVALPAI